MKLFIGSDHAGFEGKKIVAAWLRGKGYDFEDFGTFTPDSVDYPDFAKRVAQAVAKSNQAGVPAQGILLCSTAVGVSIVANKQKGIRAALVFKPVIAKFAREHNNANVLCLPGKFMSDTEIMESLETWFRSSFEGGRHERRVEKILAFEAEARTGAV